MNRTVSSLVQWIDSSAPAVDAADLDDRRIDWVRNVPFLAMHAGCLGIIWVGASWTAVGVAAFLYLVRVFAITGFYHRYFSHRTFRTSRVFQLAMAIIGNSAVQRGPMWWAAHHRHHHNHSDQDPDLHSPTLRGFLMSHTGWFLTRAGFATKTRLVRDWSRFPELRFIDRFDWFVPVLLAVGLFGLGELLARVAPSLGTNGWQLLIWGFFVSTVVLYHATYTINSLAHRFGHQRFETDDDSRNSFWLALITLGEGWHNNHHHYPASARQGFYWWEVDLTYYALKVLAWCGLIWDLRPVPARVLAEGRRGGHARDG
ncbi:MAG: acyl-CoA desaturase [Planctomycetota bacterium]|jgi:stearoyl-CoA desaturase (delta-9 desaturase)